MNPDSAGPNHIFTSFYTPEITMYNFSIVTCDPDYLKSTFFLRVIETGSREQTFISEFSQYIFENIMNTKLISSFFIVHETKL